jgi:chaperonin GroES
MSIYNDSLINNYNEHKVYPGTIEDIVNDPNIAKKLGDKDLQEIADKLYKDYLSDKDSRQAWWDTISQALKIARQEDERKNWPWEGAANIRYPLIVSAIVQYNSRTYPEVVKGDKVVNVDILGEDPQGLKEQAAKRLSRHMSFQLLKEVPNWEQEMDRLLMVLAMMGTAYKKAYYDFISKLPIIEACSPEYIIVNNSIKSLQDARRITHVVFLNEIGRAHV